jgi:hypothetical protein
LGITKLPLTEGPDAVPLAITSPLTETVYVAPAAVFANEKGTTCPGPACVVPLRAIVGSLHALAAPA